MDWHKRFCQQSVWTEPLRRHYFTRLSLKPGGRVLEVGCGTGAITAQLRGLVYARSYGLDINLAYLRLAREYDPHTRFTGGDALQLPFVTGSFDAVYCHYFLLWVQDPGAAMVEITRVTRPGGAVMAFAEPDYGGRIDYPPALAQLGKLQTEAIKAQGADPEMGRKLSDLFHAAGLRGVETGVLGGLWSGTPAPATLESEWNTLEADLAGQIPANRLLELRRQNTAAWQTGQRVLFVPTFYATGRK